MAAVSKPTKAPAKPAVEKKVDATEEKPAKQLSKKDLLNQAVSGLNKRFGAGTIGTLKEKAHEFVITRIKTRSLAFNDMIGGGWASGRLSEGFGNPDSGKTSIMLDTIGYNHEINKDFHAGWFETEGHFDVEYATKVFGIDPNRLTIWYMSDFGAEQGLDILESLIRSGAFDLLVVNTLAGLTPKVELDSNMEDSSMALQARLMSKLTRKIVAQAAKKKTHVHFVNQVRTDLGGYKGPKVSAGGLALQFWASQRVSFNAGFMNADDTKRGYDSELFKRIDCTVRKNRCCNLGNPYKKCSYYAEYGVGIDTIGEVPAAAIEAGIITVKGAWYYEYDMSGEPVKFPDGAQARWQGIGAFRAYLKANPDYVESLKTRINFTPTVATTMSAEEVDVAVQEEEEAKSTLEEIGAEITIEEETT